MTGCFIDGPKVIEDAGDNTKSTASTDDDTDSETGSDGDTDSDTDADVDTDTDADTDSDTDTDADGDSDTDVDGDTDTDTDVDGDSDIDTETDIDPDGGPDSDTVAFVCEPADTRPCQDVLGNCRDGVETCLDDGSGYGACSIQPESSDSCDPGDDADCNGVPNEGCTCVDGKTRDCGVETGVCETGTQTCTNNQWSNCVDEVAPSTRDCSSPEDNDCDGLPDNTLDSDCQCEVGMSRSCDTGDPGICQAGTQECVLGADGASSYYNACTGLVSASDEVCDVDNTDEDCDGEVNENCFEGGPCVHGPTSSETHIYARGKDGGIYRAVTPIVNNNPWLRISGLDASVLVEGDEYRIDCDGNQDFTVIMGLGSMPLGRIKQAEVYSDLSSKAFGNILDSTLYDTSPSVSVFSIDASYRFASKLPFENGATTGMVIYDVDTNGSLSPYPTPDNARPVPVTESLVSALGEARYYFTNGAYTQYVGYDVDDHLQFIFWNSNISGYSWTINYFTAPSGEHFQYSPAICRYTSGNVSNNALYSRLVVTAGNRLWMSTRTGSTEYDFGPWEQLSDTVITSAPDCDVTSDGTVHIVAKTERDTILYVYELLGTVTEIDLGEF